MRILVVEEKWGHVEPDGTVKQVVGIVEEWATLEEGLRAIEERVQQTIQKPYTVRWVPDRSLVEVDVDDPPDETLVVLWDADNLERITGKPAIEAFAYMTQNAAVLEKIGEKIGEAYFPEIMKGIKRRPPREERGS